MSTTNWRSLGDTTLAVYRSEFARRNSPLLAEVESIYSAVKGYSLLYLAQVGMESEYATTGFAAGTPSAHNALGTKVRGQPQYQRFASWTDGAKEWRARILDPGYAYARTVTLADYIHVYAPISDGNDEAGYVAFIQAYRQRFPAPDTGDTTMPTTTPTITFGRVPAPRIVKIDTSRKQPGAGWDNLGQRKPKFVVLHRMVGSLAGTDSWFANPTAPALTDFGIGIAAMDGSAKSGEIHQYNDPRGTRSGWASGPYSGAYGDGKAIVDKYGINVINRDGESLEISGNYDTPITDAEKQRIAEWIAWRWDLMHIPYTSAPINPETGISAVMWHQEFTLGTGKTCPGPVVMQATNDLIARATAILKQYQTSGDGTGGDPDPETPTYAIPQIPGWLLSWTGEPVLHDIPGVKDGTVFATTAQYIAKRATPRLQYATSGAQKVGPDIVAGERFPVAFIFTAADGKQYGVTKYGTRVLLADLEVVSDAA